jgi:hypothetical protein
VNIKYLHGCSFLEDGAHLAASNIENNLDLSTGFVENALALHLFAISSLTGCPVFAILVIISFVAESLLPVTYSRIIVCYSNLNTKSNTPEEMITTPSCDYDFRMLA